MLGYQFHPEASLEYGEAVDYYIEINPLLADAFVGEVEHAISMIRKYPNRWRLVDENVRGISSIVSRLGFITAVILI